MRAVLLEVPEAMLAERHRLGQDRKDEMWDGVLHMVPPGSYRHQQVQAALLARLYGLAEGAGLVLTTDTGVFNPQRPQPVDYRVPDLVLSRRNEASARGVEGRAALVVEIRSPGDETYEKLDFYQRMGVERVLVVQRDSLAVELFGFETRGPQMMPPSADGWIPLGVLPVALRTVSGPALELDAPGGRTTVRFDS